MPLAYEEEALPILGELALAMHRRYPTGVAPKAFVVDALAKALRERHVVSGDEAGRATNVFLERAGREVQILLDRGAGEWGFLHLTFQEFFASAGLHALERFEDEAFAHLFDPRWEEVLRLGVGYLALVQKRPEAARRFVQRVLEYEAPEPERWITSVLKKQVPLAALLAAEAGDALPESMKRRVAEELARWVCAPPGREAIFGYLKDLSGYEFREVLGEALLDTLAEHRDHCEEILHAIRRLRPSSSSGAERLINLSKDVSGDEFPAFAQALGVYYLPIPWNKFVTLLHDARPLVRAAASSILTPDDLNAIVDALNDKNPLVRDMATEMLVEWRILHGVKLDDDRGLLLSRLRIIARDQSSSARGAAAFIMGSIGTGRDVEELLIDVCLHDESERVRAEAAGALAALNSMAALDSLADPSVFVRRETAGAVQEMPPAFTLGKLLTMIADRSEHGRAGAARALGRHPDARARAAVITATADAVRAVRAAALWGFLGKPAEQPHERLLAALEDEDLEVRETAISVLGFSRFLPAMGDLVSATHAGEGRVRQAAVAALGSFMDQEQAQEAVMKAVDDPDAGVRREAIERLGILHAASRFEQLCGALTDPSAAVRAAVARVLGNLADPSAIPHLLRALPDTPTARDALWKIAERLHQPEPPAAP